MVAPQQLPILAAGTPVTGIWCDDCWTSGVISVPVFRITDDGVQPFRTVRTCLTCKPIPGINHDR